MLADSVPAPPEPITVRDDYTYTDPVSGTVYDDWYLRSVGELVLIQSEKDEGFLTLLDGDDPSGIGGSCSSSNDCAHEDAAESFFTAKEILKFAWRVLMTRSGGSGNAGHMKYDKLRVIRPCSDLYF